jgi:hypothetical protein
MDVLNALGTAKRILVQKKLDCSIVRNRGYEIGREV